MTTYTWTKDTMKELLFVHYDERPVLVTTSALKAMEALGQAKVTFPDLPWRCSTGPEEFAEYARMWNQEDIF